MNRNVESYFATNANIDINRSTFDRSQDIKFSFDVGELIPFFVDEVYPGDTFKITTSKVVRLQTLLTPVFSNCYLDTYFFFCPNRLVWTHWKNFMGENGDSAWLPEVEYSIPQTNAYWFANDDDKKGRRVVHVGDYYDYMGIPVNVPMEEGTQSTIDGAKESGEVLSFSSLPARAVQLIYNEWFRDENLIAPINISTGDSDSWLPSDEEREASLTYDGRNNLRVAKYHDYFTSALPAPLKGEPVLAPIQTPDPLGIPVNGIGTAVHGKDSWRLSTNSTTGYLRKSTGNDTFPEGALSAGTASAVGGASISTSNLYADLSSVGINIMSLRNAFQVQKLLERDARSGSRYTEVIKGHFNVESSDARLQRPEYLGGNRVPISIHQIANQSQGENEFLGDLGAMSLTTDKHDDVVFSSEEHGYIIGLCCVRYDHSYPQGLERFWSRKTRFDFYWPEFANLSEQAILNKEIYAQGRSQDNEVFGYQECWADLRYKPSRVAGEMRPGVDNTLASWHFADYYESLPHLSSGWIREDKKNIDRTLAVTSEVANQVFCDIYVQNYTTRPIPVRSVPGLADHF